MNTVLSDIYHVVRDVEDGLVYLYEGDVVVAYMPLSEWSYIIANAKVVGEEPDPTEEETEELVA